MNGRTTGPVEPLAGGVMAWLDGQPATQVPIDDRSLAYGDGAFRTLLAHDGAVVDLDGQLAVLADACAALQIPFDQPRAAAELQHAARSAQSAGATGSTVLKLIVSRGSGGSGYRPPEHPKPRHLILARPRPSRTPRSAIVWPAGPAFGARSGHSVKHLNRLDQVMAQAAAADAGVDEAILLNERQEVVCASSANLFIQTVGGDWVTPPLACGAMPGRMRQRVLALHHVDDFLPRERTLEAAELQQARAILLTNSVLGVCALRTIGPVEDLGSGTEGRAQRALQPADALVGRLLSALAHPPS